MATFLDMVSGKFKQIAAIVTSAGAGDAGKLVALDAGGKWDVSLFPTGIGPETKVMPATEALSAGNLVNIYDVGAGVVSCRKADATAANQGKIAHGFVKANVSSAANATVYLFGINDQVSGLTLGDQYLTTAGATDETAPSSTGNTVQKVGVAISATELAFFPGDPVTLA